MFVIEMEVEKSTLSKSAVIIFIALTEYLLIRKIKSLE